MDMEKADVGRVREEKRRRKNIREEKRRERVRRKKMKARDKVEKSRNDALGLRRLEK